MSGITSSLVLFQFGITVPIFCRQLLMFFHMFFWSTGLAVLPSSSRDIL